MLEIGNVTAFRPHCTVCSVLFRSTRFQQLKYHEMSFYGYHIWLHLIAMNTFRIDKYSIPCSISCYPFEIISTLIVARFEMVRTCTWINNIWSLPTGRQRWKSLIFFFKKRRKLEVWNEWPLEIFFRHYCTTATAVISNSLISRIVTNQLIEDSPEIGWIRMNNKRLNISIACLRDNIAQLLGLFQLQ